MLPEFEVDLLLRAAASATPAAAAAPSPGLPSHDAPLGDPFATPPSSLSELI